MPMKCLSGGAATRRKVEKTRGLPFDGVDRVAHNGVSHGLVAPSGTG